MLNTQTADWNDVRVELGRIRGVLEAGHPIDKDDALMMVTMSEMLIAHIKHLQGGSAEIKREP
ncbi:hypothetical protein [Nocardia asiatica]|uniref:hypothetical protein n=1 Tax=Nocardia asiatica TaxID=209252 RepID=UPI0024580F4A|nr:hypothetical protein [Nocardia asiatica]